MKIAGWILAGIAAFAAGFGLVCLLTLLPDSTTPPVNMSMGCLPRTSVCGDGTFPVFSAMGGGLEALPRGEWRPVSMRHLVWQIMSQKDGMCTSNASNQCLQINREQAGLPRVRLSEVDLYARVGRWGSGSTLDDNLTELMTRGVRDEEHCPEQWPVRRPKDWKQNAARYRGTEAYDLAGDFGLLATALQLGFPCNIGVNWPGGGGHSVCVTELKRDGNGWKVGGPNSWGSAWGDEGFYWLSERQCRSMSTYGAFAMRVATVPSDEVNVPDVPARELRLAP